MNTLTPILNGYVRTALIEAVYYKEVTVENYRNYIPYRQDNIGKHLVELSMGNYTVEVAYCYNEAAARSLVEEIARRM